jgi:GNAT superfamily N-acetyltransferase
MIIQQMRVSDLDFAVECTTSEGWMSETREVFEGFLAYDPSGCFIVEECGKRIGLCVATIYSEFGFLGEIIVVKERRGCGVGRRLVKHVVGNLRSRRVFNVLLDSVPAAVSLYERFGFNKLCRSLRFGGNLQGRLNPLVRAMQYGDLEGVKKIDRDLFGGDRGFFLERGLHLYPELCKVIQRDGQLAGFIMGRRGRGVVWVGPWETHYDVERPEDLLEDLAAEVGTPHLILGVLETNTKAVAKVRSLGLEEHPNPPWRMVLGSSGELSRFNQLYAIGSPAKG